MFLGMYTNGDFSNLLYFESQSPYMQINFKKFSGPFEYAERLWHTMDSFLGKLNEINEDLLPNAL